MPGSSMSNVRVNKDDKNNFEILLDGFATVCYIRDNLCTLRDCHLQHFRIRELRDEVNDIVEK